MKTSAWVLCGLLALGSVARAQQPVAADRSLAREILEELVEIPTTEADGTARAAEAIAGRLLAAGFPKHDVHIITSDGNVANVVARFRGTRPDARGVLLMAHIDVVPALR
jgi:acetylornithine deacetylase/succinyl-diaminopimelate desuccinylase-like protein